MFKLKLVGNYKYSGAIIEGQKYSIVRNGNELVRVSKVFNEKNADLIWDNSKSMSLEVLNILKLEMK